MDMAPAARGWRRAGRCPSGSAVTTLAACLALTVVAFAGVVPAGPVTESPRDSAQNGKPEPYRGRKLLLILLDGFRWDYVDKYGDLAGFNRMRQEGVYAEYSVPVFPSMTMPNMYSIATGRYPENHGILDNYMYDREKNETMELGPFHSDFKESWWQEAEPLWITATKAGLRAHLYLWYGCEFEIRGHKAEACQKYNKAYGAFQFREQVYDILDKFAEDEADLCMLYVESTDFIGHVFGPQTKMMDLAVHDVDSVIDLLLYRIGQKGLQEKVNVIVTSDHGMTTTDLKTVKKMRISQFINMDDVQLLLSSGAMTSIIAKENRANQIYDSLKSVRGLNVWLKGDIPEAFHFKRNKLVPDIVVVAKKGFALSQVLDAEKQLPRISLPIPFDFAEGNHGYLTDNFPDMRGILYGWGPDMRKHEMVPPVRTIDVYNLASHLIGVTPLPNNGSWDAVRAMLRNVEDLPVGHQQQSSGTLLTAGRKLTYVLSLLIIYRNFNI